MYAHNFRGFDSHLIMKALKAKMSVFETISRNEEQIIALEIDKYKFIDTASFMPDSLDKLVSLVKDKGPDHFVQTKKWAKENFDVFLSKGIFPYEYITDINVLKETCLPPKEAFTSKLKDMEISDMDYQRAKDTWKKFGCKTLGDYMRIYCEADVHLLADVWRNFCDDASTSLEIQPEAGYLTLPSYAFDVFKNKLKKEDGIELRVIPEEMRKFHNDILHGIRGGSCLLKKKISIDTALENYLISKANKEEMKRYKEIQESLQIQAEKRTIEYKEILGKGKTNISYNSCSHIGCSHLVKKPKRNCEVHKKKCIVAFDFNNLYGDSMTRNMPLDQFENLSDDELHFHQELYDKIYRDKKVVNQYKEETEKGYIFVAKIKFPKHAQRKLVSFPIVPDQMVVEEEMLSEHQKTVWKKLFKGDYKCVSKKMVNSFAKKENYVGHYRLLAFYASLGVKITLQRGYKFRQKKFIANYVKYCAQMRKLASTNFEKKMWKNMVNINYGKFIEDPKKRVHIKYLKSFEDLDATLKFHVDGSPKVINEQLVQVNVYISLMKLSNSNFLR